MQHEARESQLIELTREFPRTPAVHFDSERLCLTGSYSDELSAHRARRVWKTTLESTFLLETGSDFRLEIDCDAAAEEFSLHCTFLTACARYAFWRLTNSQSPEAQYMIETAHIPLCSSRHEDFIQAPDLAPSPRVLTGLEEMSLPPFPADPNSAAGLSAILTRLWQKISRNE